ILDGFDLGAGIVNLIASKSEDDRTKILQAIGPYWDGNEVWLIAAGGVLYFAFPKLYAASFSGFYLPLMIVLWLLMLRGLGIEFRHQFHHPMWSAFWNTLFSISSLLLAVFFGAALGNVVRGVPLNAEGYFFEPLWTTFTIVPDAGILDWFTVIMGLVALCTLTVHGANYIAMRTDGGLQLRSRRIAKMTLPLVVLLSIAALISAFSIRAGLEQSYLAHPWGLIFPLLALAGLAGMFIFPRNGDDAKSFISSSVFIGAMLASTAFAMYPNVLPASTVESRGLTIFNSAAGAYGLSIGAAWWVPGLILAMGYFTYLYRSFRGKVTVEEGGY
ncbi:MAG TPA: cytochrome d ubiquinol oxidase subunit II, partial [Bacteroidota bacterium]|nr:cytochrome d ubiquinol oxidase subunit II [Bacteroidota bacterium]